VRKMVMMVAVMVLAGCDGGKPAEPAKVSSQPPVTQATPNATPQWTIQVELKEALSDMAYWLVEHHYPSYVVKVDGKETVMIGPFKSQAEAEKAKTDIDAAMAKAHRLSELEIIPPKA
jgi:cell division septation protein DedD